jgi:hypothetical protein
VTLMRSLCRTALALFAVAMLGAAAAGDPADRLNNPS